ncbi:hypothetical protein NV379_14785 [Paenibacillus sp. N1-5-1-14]|uniref:hypothetical protein n=1 Tax=Paenibacillus radicibacter TaxID=2972488 RepID=UPI002159778B|nr:hypothetical protein [Paenibacillus radicibacter]MCR8643919.1 hypothetical protein [Paenibacillus radicibacter]
MFELNVIIAIIGSLIGLAVTGGAIYTVWFMLQARKLSEGQDAGNKPHHLPVELLRWNVLDYMLIGLFLVGMLMLGADLFAVLRDKASFPDYHIAYLVGGFIFSFLGMVLLFLRFMMLYHALHAASLPNHKAKPDHGDHAESGI